MASAPDFALTKESIASFMQHSTDPRAHTRRLTRWRCGLFWDGLSMQNFKPAHGIPQRYRNETPLTLFQTPGYHPAMSTACEQLPFAPHTNSW